jgi:hypothetical protein
MGQFKPPSPQPQPNSSLFYIGKDSRGNWVVQDRSGMRGGLFIDRAEALRYALFENGNRPRAVVMVPGIFELDMSRNAGAPSPPAIDAIAPHSRQAA